jgi:glutathione S-transferase
MELIGMLDSPYVRRVAIGLQLLGLPFTHRSISVFRGVDQLAPINPVLKAPTLVADDGTVLMDSTLILAWAHTVAAPRTLAGSDALHAARVLGLALAGCEKAVQLVYERARPEEKRHAPWVERVTAQARQAFALLEQAFEQRPPTALDDAAMTAAVVWTFTQDLLPGLAPPEAHPRQRNWAAQAEAHPAFRAAPHGDGVYPVA